MNVKPQSLPSFVFSLLLAVSLLMAPATANASDLPQTPKSLGLDSPKNSPGCVVPPFGLISWWPGNGNAQDLTGDNHGLMMNGAAFTTGMVGQAFSLDGVDDYISIPKVNTWDFGTTSFSINAWFKSDTGGYRNIIRYDTGYASSGFWGVRFNPQNKLEFIVADSIRTTYVVETDNIYTDNSWHLVSAVRDSVNGKLKIYIDGSPAATDVGDGASNIIGSAAAQLWIGGGAWGGEYFKGFVDEVNVLNRALSAAEIDALYHAGSAGMCQTSCITLPTGITSWWPGDGTADDFIRGNDGTLINGTTFDAGLVDQAFRFDGLDDRVDVGNNVGDFVSESFSFDFWMFSYNDGGGGTYLMGKSYPDAGLGWDIRLKNGTIEVVGVNGWGMNIASAAVIIPNTWYHIALSASSSDVVLYINGAVAGSSGRSAISSTGNPFRIGYTTNFGGYPYTGLLDEVDIFNRTLTEIEVANLYNAGSGGKCKICATPPADMASWWGGNNNPLDLVGDNHGTLMDGASYADGMVRQAFSLDGSEDYVALPDAASYLLNDASGTIAAWVNPSVIGDNDIILAYGSGEVGQGIGLGIYGTVRIYHHTSTYDWQSTTSVPANQWTFLAYTWDDTTETIYKNGEFSESRSRETANDFTYVPGHARLGHGFWGDPANAFPGRIDEPLAFNRTLSADEILAMVQAGGSGMCASHGIAWVSRDSDSIYHAELDGSNPQDITPAGGTSDLIGLSHDPFRGKMYYTSYATDTIYRANPDGTGVESVTPIGVDGPMGIKIDPTDGKMYFVTWGGSVNRANLDGSNLEILIDDAGSELVGIALDNYNDEVYYTGFTTSKIFRVGWDGGIATEVVVSGCTVNQPEMIELDVLGGKMYWANFSGSICRAKLDGTEGEMLASGASVNGATGIALDLVRGKLYWTNAGNSTLYRANLDGSNPEDITPITGVNNPQSISVEMAEFFPPRVQSVTRDDPNPTFADSVTFTVTFSESVTGVKLSDFVTHYTGGLSGVLVTGLSGSGTTYRVTVNTGTGSGTLQLGVGDGDTILDLSGSPLGGYGLGNGDYIDGETYEVRPPQIFLPLIIR